MTRRVQFQRSSVTGAAPSRLQAGTPAFNWPDQKIHVGGAGDTPAFSIRRIDDWDQALVYRTGEFVIYTNNLYRALRDIPSNLAFNDSDWLKLTDTGSLTTGAVNISGVIEGGSTSMLDSRNVQIAAGSGIVTNTEDPSNTVITLVQWGDFTASFSPASTDLPSFAMFILANGTVNFQEKNNPTSARSGILLCSGLFNTATQEMTRLWDARQYTTRMLQSAADEIDTPEWGEGFYITPSSGTLELSDVAGVLIGRDVNKASAAYPNEVSVNLPSPATFDLLSTSGADLGSDKTEVPNAQYDNGGVLTNLGAGECVVHRLGATIDGELILQYGTTAYGNLSIAKAQYPVDRKNGDVPPAWPVSACVEVATIYVTPECTDLSDAATSAIFMPLATFEYFPTSDQDLAAYLRLDGTTPMGADLPLGGFAPAGGVLDGEKSSLEPKDLATGVEPIAPKAREMQVSGVDRKVYLGTDPVADRTEYYVEARIYLPGDTCFYSNVMYVCLINTTGGFNAGDWQAIGSVSDISSAIIKVPDSSARNTIDLEAAGDFTGLTVKPNASQTADIAVFGDARVDRYSMGVGTFGSIVVRIAQANHGFGSRGQPVAFKNPNWVLADASDTTVGGKTLGVVYRVVDSNNFDLQFGGEMKDLETGAFVGGSISAGFAYYVSATEAGKLTATAPATPNRVDPVLVTTTSTDGVLQLTSAADVNIEGAQGNTVFTVSETGHPYGADDIGRPVYQFSEGVWSLAAAGDAATVGVAMISDIIDVNNYVVAMAGLITDVSALAFAGGVAPVAGRAYYVSQDTPGILTEIAPEQQEIRNLLFWATSPTTGFVSSYEPENPSVGALGEQLVGGPLKVQGDQGIQWGGDTGDEHRLIDNDGAGNGGMRIGHKYDNTGGLISPYIATQAGGAGVVLRGQVDNTSPGEFEVWLMDDGTTNGDGSLNVERGYKFSTDDTAFDGVLRRTDADGEYLRLDATNSPVTGDVRVDANVTLRGSLNAGDSRNFTVEGSTGTNKASFGIWGTDPEVLQINAPNLDNSGWAAHAQAGGPNGWKFWVSSDNGSSNTLVGKFVDDDASSMASGTEIATRAKGDGRWVRLNGATAMDGTLALAPDDQVHIRGYNEGGDQSWRINCNDLNAFRIAPYLNNSATNHLLSYSIPEEAWYIGSSWSEDNEIPKKSEAVAKSGDVMTGGLEISAGTFDVTNGYVNFDRRGRANEVYATISSDPGSASGVRIRDDSDTARTVLNKTGAGNLVVGHTSWSGDQYLNGKFRVAEEATNDDGIPSKGYVDEQDGGGNRSGPLLIGSFNGETLNEQGGGAGWSVKRVTIPGESSNDGTYEVTFSTARSRTSHVTHVTCTDSDEAGKMWACLYSRDNDGFIVVTRNRGGDRTTRGSVMFTTY